MRAPKAGLVVLLLLVAGCSTPSEPSGTPAPSASPSMAPETQRPGESSVAETRLLEGETRTDFHLTGCLDPRMLFLLDPTAAQTLLPHGFTAADAGGLVQFTGVLPSSPVPVGRAVGGYDFLACATDSLGGGSAAFSQVGILVNPPNLGARTPVDPATFDLYLLALHVDQPAWHALALASGFTPQDAPLATIASQVHELAAGQHQGAGNVAVGGPLGEATYGVASAANPLDIRARYWHVAENGTFYFEFRLKEEVRAGPILTCSHAEGSAFAKVAGTTSCTTQTRFAAVGLDTTVEGTAYWVPGVLPV